MTPLEFFEGVTLARGRYERLPKAMADFFRRAGLEDAAAAEAERMGYGHFADSVYPPPHGFHRLCEGQVLTINGRDWRVVVGRGHSREHACLYCPSLDLFISGDQILPRISSNVSVHASEPEANPLEDWLISLEHMKSVPDSVLVLPAHGQPFHGLHDRADTLITGHNNQLRRLLRSLTEPRTAVDCLVTMFHRELKGFQRFMGVGETLAHLHLLVHRGEVAYHDDEAGVRRFRAIGQAIGESHGNTEG